MDAQVAQGASKAGCLQAVFSKLAFTHFLVQVLAVPSDFMVMQMQPHSIYASTFVLMATYYSKTQLLDATGSSLEVLQSCSVGGFQASTGHLQRPRTAAIAV